MALTDQAHLLIEHHFTQWTQEKSLAIDATCGNGNDTEFLCSLGFDHVLAFDIQPRAIDATRQRLERAGFKNATLLCKSHRQIETEVIARNRRINCAMFNLGYLPRGDKAVTTQAESTLAAISQSMNNLADTGIITVLCYPGHPNGAFERDQLRATFDNLQSPWSLDIHHSESATQSTPVLYVLRRTHPI